MSYFDRLPLYVTPEEPSWFWNFPMSVKKEQHVSFSYEKEIQNHLLELKLQEELKLREIQQLEEVKQKLQLSEKLFANDLLHYEWVDEMLEKMYLNDEGKFVVDACEKKEEDSTNIHNRESEELMFQFDLDWDIEKGKL
jgi:hypothetical protein